MQTSYVGTFFVIVVVYDDPKRNTYHGTMSSKPLYLERHGKAQIFWEGHKIWQNPQFRFDINYV